MRRVGSFHASIFSYREGRYARVTLLLVLACLAVYLWPPVDQPRNGGTWQGYVLGGIGTFLILLLTWLGVRKRRYRSRLGTVQGWVSAHVYLGLGLIIIATLHTGFQFGSNIHTVAYGLMMLVIVSGIVGIWSYIRLPRATQENRQDRSREELLAEVGQHEKQAMRLAGRLDADIQAAVRSGLQRTVVGGGVLDQLRGVDRSLVELPVEQGKQAVVANADQRALISYLAERIACSPGGQETVIMQDLLWSVSKRKAVLRRIRRDIRLQGWMQVWLMVHVPLTFALLAALAAHIFSVFFYW